MSTVKPNRYTELKARVKAECLRRAYTGSVAGYGGADYDYNATPAAGTIIKREHRDKIAEPLHAITANAPAATGQNIVAEDDMLAMEAVTANLESFTDVTANSSNTGCSASCTGLCYTACTGSCRGGCTGSCSGSCKGGCRGCGGCDGTCSGSCSGSCSGDGCTAYCGMSCWAVCASSCSGGCDSNCGTGCTGTAKTR